MHGMQVDFIDRGSTIRITSVDAAATLLRDRGCSLMGEAAAQPDNFAILLQYLREARSGRVVQSFPVLFDYLLDDYGIDCTKVSPRVIGHQLQYVVVYTRPLDRMRPITVADRTVHSVRIDLTSHEVSTTPVEPLHAEDDRT
ncbi:MAG: hypothetical protein KF773_10990 [Deltaproteobacteria bacterium]|nr:hypothetical protein [Deltaproteobacteria bacterium]